MQRIKNFFQCEFICHAQEVKFWKVWHHAGYENFIINNAVAMIFEVFSVIIDEPLFLCDQSLIT